MDILAWAVKNQETKKGRILIWLLYRSLRAIVPKGILVNWMTCAAFVQGLHRLDDATSIVVCFGGLLDAGSRAREMTNRRQVSFWLAGNKQEQELFKRLYGSDESL